jgi:hypothetical protein
MNDFQDTEDVTQLDQIMTHNKMSEGKLETDFGSEEIESFGG